MQNKQVVSVSHPKAAALGLQHLLAMYSGSVLVPLLIGGALHFSASQMTYLVSIDIFMCGLATLLQIWTNRFVGIGLPVVLGCAVQAVEPLKMIGERFTIGTMYGAIIAAGAFVFLIAGAFSKIKRLFPPLVTGTLITVIGLTLIPVAFTNLGGGDASAKNFGSPDSLAVGFLTVLVILAVNVWGVGFIRQIAVLIGLLVGTIVAAFMGMVSLQPVAEASWLHFPQPFYFGAPHFEWSSILTMILVSLVSMVESTGVFFALGDITNRKIESSDLKKGYRAEALAVMLGGIFNTFPYTTFSQNVGLVQLSGIKTRKPIFYSAGFLILLGLLPKVGAMATIIPTPVLGGAMLVMFGMVAIQGIRMLRHVDFHNDKNVLIAALSIGLGLGVSVEPTIFQSLPTTLQLLLGNGIVMASLSAVLLNLILRPRQPEAELEEDDGLNEEE
ncbi:nucleobase:cation symporter-2 family protein [Loigolactobacillus coryniformis]|jgi:xanthine permease|uniref:Uric acid permease PucJ n=1 Tax=Loigolactobacillus coryniformis subsp. torquens DSM 20004 = KCTC 3535 TaxID=1423822 RepID=A0A2D1KR31_9LACO|nr:nucleobase:cation symporter-2 family protein [Loigolactobacillus coryniformis]ATO44598.1 Uric acid permease PucJ [Loigolactobacillus coryniformis subsp. torquens DSM 20004 = KCTC 3535]KRK82197.1 Xanthine uracil permease [Loigolactobacillus coryniformis subsp. torquens DSM 20004 = KCTC 3535]MBW4803338.1 purine permease [Loigolactobacillus coryniformis subsp. torquens]MBW4806034.1 purine permease [Loigolactobacillus coryniformis subsp. torquens]